MSKSSKSKRDVRKRRRVSSQDVGSQRKKAAESERESRLWLWVGGVVFAVLMIGGAYWFTVGPGRSKEELSRLPATPAERNGRYGAPPPMQIDLDKAYTATIETEKGDIVIELYAEKAPNTVNNFVFLAREGFYDDTTFHRVLSGFMAQAGDPSGTGSGGPGYQFPDEFHVDLKHDRPGILSMANSGANTNGSQFFITYVATPWLDAYDSDGNLKECLRSNVSCHAVFGAVIGGMDLLNSLTIRDPSQSPSFAGDLIKTVRIDER
jgi:cyclophilin family peptidyl-prolyl cis-trans isomerase